MGLEVKERGEILNPSATDTRVEVEAEVEDDKEIPTMPFWKAVMIPGVLQFAFSFFFIKFAYYGVYYWVPTYLEQHLGYSKTEAANI